MSEEAEQKTDAQEMTDVLNEVKDVSEPAAVEQVAPKAKAKKASRAKASPGIQFYELVRKVEIGRAHV